jgi:hypothetical protein
VFGVVLAGSEHSVVRMFVNGWSSCQHSRFSGTSGGGGRREQTNIEALASSSYLGAQAAHKVPRRRLVVFYPAGPVVFPGAEEDLLGVGRHCVQQRRFAVDVELRGRACAGACWTARGGRRLAAICGCGEGSCARGAAQDPVCATERHCGGDDGGGREGGLFGDIRCG